MILKIIDGMPFNDELGYLERSRRFIEYNKWAAAFKPLLARARSSADRRLLKSATVIRANYLTNYMALFAGMLNFRENYCNRQSG
jgi:hypothetical protein